MSKNIALIFLFLLAGCSSLSGYDSKTKFACAASEGVTCMSMTGVYENIAAGNIGQTKKREVDAAATQETTPKKADDYFRQTGLAHEAIKSGTPLRTATRELRIWYAPWEDADGDLNDQSYTYMVIDTGRWMMERVHAEIVKNFMPAPEHNGVLLDFNQGVSEKSTSANSQNEPKKSAPVTLGTRQSASSNKSDAQTEVSTNGNQFPNFNDVLKKIGVSDAAK